MSLGFLQFAFEATSAIALAATPAQPTPAHPAIPAVSRALSPAATRAAAPAAMPADDSVVSEAAALRPGEFVWQPERSTEGAVEIVVSIPLQRAYVYRGGTLIAVTTVSTGRRGHSTPTGTFNILEKDREHYSSLYNNAPMPFMQRLTWGGVALHAGHIPGRPASHGCVRLPLAFARHLYGVTSVGAAVHIVAGSPSAGEALALVRGNAAFTGMGGPEEDVQTGTN
jgi:lipoprotein-anchoring transpeptidase ErfK/SrfK